MAVKLGTTWHGNSDGVLPSHRPNAFPASLAAGGGRVGLWVIGATYNDPAVLDDCGGGTVTP